LTFGIMKVVKSSPLRTGRLYPQEFSWYSVIEADSTPGHMVPSVATESPATSLGIDPKTFRLVAQCLNLYATPGPVVVVVVVVVVVTTNSWSANQAIPRVLCKYMVYYRIQKNT
jgi:hypothetical protein